jgi:hypothetical protein
MTAEELAAYCLAKPGAWETGDTSFDLVVSRIQKLPRPQGA